MIFQTAAGPDLSRQLTKLRLLANPRKDFRQGGETLKFVQFIMISSAVQMFSQFTIFNL